MRGMILVAAIAAAPAPAAAEPLVDKPVKATFSTPKAVGETSQCVAKELNWYGPAISVPAPEGAQRLQFAFWNKSVTDILIMPGEATRIDVRGVTTKRLKSSISRCL